MEDEKGTPWIARIPWLWAVPLSLITAGAFPLLIGIYLSVWVRDKRHAGLAIYGYGVIVVLAILEILLAGTYFHSAFWNGISNAGVILWVVDGFLLRRELQLQYARPDGSVPQMSVLWTALFSVFYLNYCVWAESDTA
jgi:hypothetical protein